MKKQIATLLLITLAAAAVPKVAHARDHRYDDGRGYSRVEDRMGQLDSRLARLAALRDRFGSDAHLRREINRTANQMERIRVGLHRRNVSSDYLRRQTDEVSWRLSRLEDEYRHALSYRPRGIYRHHRY